MGLVQTNWRASTLRAALGEGVVPVTGTPVSQLLADAPRPGHDRDEEHVPWRGRIRPIGDADADTERMISMATMYRAAGLGPLRTFSGALAHENGWFPSWKGGRLLHWEGAAQRELLVRCETDHGVERVFSESMALEFPFEGGFATYTGDVETHGPAGITVSEVKRDERDLADPRLRRVLAIVAEILRRCDIGFRIIFRDEIFRDRIHRANAELFAARAFVPVESRHLSRLTDHALRNGCNTTFGALAEALDPASRNLGKAIVQALTVRRQVTIGLEDRLTSNTPLTIN